MPAPAILATYLILSVVIEPMQYIGRIFDGEKVHELAEVGINQETGTIEYIEDTRRKDPRYEGMTLMPGMIDVHIHFFGVDSYNLMDWVLTPDVILTIKSVNDASRLLDAGFTTVRTLGDKVSLGMSKAEKQGIIRGPRIISAGFSLAETGGNDDPKRLPIHMSKGLSYSYYCDGPWECRKAVRMNVREGAEAIKVYASTSFVGGGPIRDELTLEELSSISAEAHKFHLKATAHAYGESAITHTIEGGFDSVEHGLGLTAEQAELMVKRGIYYVPTMSVYMRERDDVNAYRDMMISHHLKEEVKLAFESGVKIAAGTDYVGSYNEPHGENYREPLYLSGIIGPLEALRSVTSIAADCLGVPEIGRVASGKKADIIAVKGKPDLDAKYLAPENVAIVIKNGKLQKGILG